MNRIKHSSNDYRRVAKGLKCCMHVLVIFSSKKVLCNCIDYYQNCFEQQVRNWAWKLWINKGHFSLFCCLWHKNNFLNSFRYFMMFHAMPDAFCKPQQVSCVHGCPISLIYLMKFNFFLFIGVHRWSSGKISKVRLGANIVI